MRALVTSLLAVSIAASTTPTVAQMGRSSEAGKAAAGTLPEGWSARADKDAPLTDVTLAKSGDGWHFTTGPAVVAYRDTDRTSGNYHLVATFTQTKAPEYPEAFGLVFGGSDLKGAGQKYTYFLIRGDGKFLVKQRDGTGTSNVSPGWAENAAIKPQDGSGKSTNTLAVGVSGQKVSFTVNDKEVFTTDASKIPAQGIAGLRINHSLDVQVSGFAIHRQ